MRFRRLLIFALTLLAAQELAATPSMALGYRPKYPADFAHFDYTDPAAPKGGRLVLPAIGGYDTLNPYTLKGDKEAGISAMTVESLMAQSEDEPFSAYPLIARDIALAPDKLSVTFKLDPRARFSNGKPVTPADVVFSFDTLTRDPSATPGYRFYYGDVARAVAVDAQTVRFDFKRPNAELHLIVAQLPIFSRDWIPKGKTLADVSMTPPIGTGPYKLSSYALGRQSEFARRTDYWAQKLPSRRGMYNFDRIVYRYYKDETARLEAFKAGEFDLSAENVAKQWARGYQGDKFDDGRIVKKTLPHGAASGMQGFVFNLRNPLFADRRVREALTLAFDFEWLNRQLFYGQYKRSGSYFSNSEMAAQGWPSEEELAILEPVRAKLDPEVFGLAVEPPVSDSRYGVRENLKRARSLLMAAGWRYQGGRLVDKLGQPFRFEFLSYSRTYERIVAQWQKQLGKLGVELAVRVVDPAIFQRRMNDFAYDTTVVVYGASQSPGNEQQNFHGCQAAKTPGSSNWAGLCDPGIEAILPRFQRFENRQQLVSAARALDRVLRAGRYVVPNWHIPYHRAAWWDRFGQPATLPRYYDVTNWAIQTWWAKPGN
ncbi:extracellular solute-binding protein [Crenobacter cavernae]|uniref:ABC transporter substrate-binding protein n=1 Tax=Crenobacter cavernae TaxID=2290923 RepID=A0A345Y9C9_9NEIS|nr:extracellular solute-binding protein [Crenobacter cavernae]AXK40531.1 ABC transporter substrate-binding protein [Crenobacter cavernae]